MEKDNKVQLQKGWFYRIQYLWRVLTPFWMFRDAASGTAEQRSANYRFNRSRRNILPIYIIHWIGIAACLMLTTQILSSLMLYTARQPFYHMVAALFCMSVGIGFACACVVVAVLSASYLFLTYVRA